jgi:hypothetical protein
MQVFHSMGAPNYAKHLAATGIILIRQRRSSSVAWAALRDEPASLNEEDIESLHAKLAAALRGTSEDYSYPTQRRVFASLSVISELEKRMENMMRCGCARQ